MLALTGSRAAAEDCTQEAYVKALGAYDRWRGDEAPEAWILRIAINTAISHRGKERLREVCAFASRPAGLEL